MASKKNGQTHERKKIKKGQCRKKKLKLRHIEKEKQKAEVARLKREQKWKERELRGSKKVRKRNKK